MTSELSVFAARLRDLIPLWLEDHDTPLNALDAEFNGYALLLFALQFGNNPFYRKLCEVRGVTPDSLTHWTQIPAVPTSAFKDYDVTSLPPEERTAVFHSSGTTEQRPSRHFHNAESLDIYEASLWPWFEQNVINRRTTNTDPLSPPKRGEGRGEGILAGKPIILTPSTTSAPHSSLAHMFDVVRRKMDAPGSIFYGAVGPDGTWNLDCERVAVALRETSDCPAVVLGTAFSFVHLLDHLAEKNLCLTLPAGSRVMETGGYKGRSRTLPKAELHALITRHLGLPASHIICEYGMSELSSQAYDQSGSHRGDEVEIASAATNPEVGRVTPCAPSIAIGPAAGRGLPALPRPFHFPPWARVQIVSPETGREVADGETGPIRIFDLANVFSVMALQTEDLAVRRGNGFELLGRSTEAEPRGCSLMSVTK